MSEARILVLGYGNPGRQDDGLGPAMAIAIERLALPNVTAHENYQLVIEDALDVAEHDVVWFVDASKAGPTPYFVSDLSPSPSIAFTSHAVEPEVILAIARTYFGGSPRAFLLGIRGYAFEFVEEITSGARDNLNVAFAMLRQRIVLHAGAGP